MVMMLTLAFGLIKLEHLLERKNPSITSNESETEADEEFSLTSDHFMMAFSVLDFHTIPALQKAKTDP